MDAKIRKKEINLLTLGTGIIFFGAWMLIKLAISVLSIIPDINKTYSTTEIFIAVLFILAIAALIFLIYLYVGVSARSESKGKRKKPVYLVVTVILILLTVLSAAADISFIFNPDVSILEVVTALLIDGTSLVFLIELMVNAIAVRKERKKEATA